MSAKDPPEFLDRLIPAVATFATARFALADDLSELARIRRIEAKNATVLACSRVLEALACHSLEQSGLTVSQNLTTNLECLRQLDLLPGPCADLAHALRRAGNAARHVLRRLTKEDADVATACLEAWLRWYFVEFPGGPRLPRMTQDGREIGFSTDPAIDDLISTTTAGSSEAVAIAAERMTRGGGPGTDTPVLPALIADRLISEGNLDAAADLLDAALARDGSDLRLRQLRALIHSRHGQRLGEAASMLEGLLQEGWDDVETLGILGGVHKRAFRAGDADALARAIACYRRGWKASRSREPYLGINVATLSLFAGDTVASRTTAKEVRTILMGRQSALDSHFRGRSLGYWDAVTLAEATLLDGNPETAQALYQQAFAEHPLRHGDHGTTQRQRDLILQYQSGRGNVAPA